MLSLQYYIISVYVCVPNEFYKAHNRTNIIYIHTYFFSLSLKMHLKVNWLYDVNKVSYKYRETKKECDLYSGGV